MSDNLKYDALLTYAANNARSRDIDNILSMKIETDLGKQLVVLIGKLMKTEDDTELDNLKSLIDNVQKDIEDSKKGREERLKMSKEMPEEMFAMDITDTFETKDPRNTTDPTS